MTELILPKPPVNSHKKVPLRRCGNCWWHETTPDPNTVLCQAVPPTPIVIGARQMPVGPPEPIVVSFWPQTMPNQKACRCYTPPQGPKPDDVL